MSSYFLTHDEAVRRALSIVTAQRCARGQHYGCEHRVVSPFVQRALSNNLPVRDYTGHVRNFMSEETRG